MFKTLNTIINHYGITIIRFPLYSFIHATKQLIYKYIKYCIKKQFFIQYIEIEFIYA